MENQVVKTYMVRSITAYRFHAGHFIQHNLHYNDGCKNKYSESLSTQPIKRCGVLWRMTSYTVEEPNHAEQVHVKHSAFGGTSRTCAPYSTRIGAILYLVPAHFIIPLVFNLTVSYN